MILEVQIQNFDTHVRQSLNFQKILGGPNINIFGEYYVKEQAPRIKFEIWV